MKRVIMIPTYEEALAITKKNKNFFEKVEEVGGLSVSIFGHRLASYTDFYDENDNETHALELRGITYVRDSNGGAIDCYPALRKFFNINQTKGSMYDDLVNVPITRVQDKLDGSLINFIYDGSIFHAKSKMTFYSEQALEANKILARDYKLKKFLYACNDGWFGEKMFPTFELVGPWNKIVLDYRDTKLILLQLRREDGTLVDFSGSDWIDKLFDMGIEFSKEFFGDPYHDIDFLLFKCATLNDTEGFIVTFKNGKMVKFKTKWYFDMHKLVTEHVTSENVIIEMTLNETIDDALVQLDREDVRRKYAEDIATKFSNWFNTEVDRVESILEYDPDITKRKRFAQKHNGDPLFSVMMKSFNDSSKVQENLKVMMLKSLRKLGSAQEFVKNILNIQKDVDYKV